MAKDKSIKLKKNYIALVVFVFLVALFYGNTLSNGFVLDDLPQIVENPYVHSLCYLPKVITGCIWESDLGSCKGNTIHYRPLYSLSFLLTWQVSSQPWFFHLVTLIYFLIAAYLVFIFIRRLSGNFIIAFLSGLLFIIHPVNSEVANWISAVPELGLVIFSLLAFIFYLRYHQYGLRRDFVFVYLFYFFSLLSKELALFVVPLMILAIDLIILKISPKKLLKIEQIKKYLFFVFPIIIYLALRISALAGLGRSASGAGSLYGLSLTERISAFFYLFTLYVKELIYPYPLIFFHEFPISINLGNPFFICAFLLILAYVLVFSLALKKKKLLIAFALAWIFLFSLPSLIFFNFSGKNVFFSRYLAGASIGFSLLCSCFINYLWANKQEGLVSDKRRRLFSFLKRSTEFLSIKSRRILVFVSIFLLATISFGVIHAQNQRWKDSVILARANISLNPVAFYANTLREFLALFFRRQGKNEEAMNVYQEIIQQAVTGYDLSHIYNSLAEGSLTKGEDGKAEEYYRQAVRSAGTGNYTPLNNLGLFYMERGEHVRALLSFCQAVITNPQAQEPQLNLDRVATLLNEAKGDNLPLLYKDIVAVLQKDMAEKIRYKEQNCSDKNCSFVFSVSFSGGEIVLPFLIMGYQKTGEIFKPDDLSFDQEKGEIQITLPIEFKGETISFIFPTCSGVYYEVTASRQQ